MIANSCRIGCEVMPCMKAEHIVPGAAHKLSVCYHAPLLYHLHRLMVPESLRFEPVLGDIKTEAHTHSGC